ncbi:GNAT family N-acetyltransferase [Staphylococcus pasteuri]|uniref:GNAT family N-acetyltransferase n=1 Tax=Staphylococcus pasteuri TaxID=45972 RepID=UPI003260B356
MNIIKSNYINDEILNLLLQANPDKEKVIDDFNNTENFLLKDDDKTKGIILLDLISPKEIEILNFSINSNYQNQGLGKYFLNQIFIILKNNNYKKVTLGTGNSSIGQLAFYQKLGFRIHDIRKNHFINNYAEPIFENDIQCMDLIILEKFL